MCDGCDNRRDNGAGRAGVAWWNGFWGRLEGILGLAEEMLRARVPERGGQVATESRGSQLVLAFGVSHSQLWVPFATVQGHAAASGKEVGVGCQQSARWGAPGSLPIPSLQPHHHAHPLINGPMW